MRTLIDPLHPTDTLPLLCVHKHAYTYICACMCTHSYILTHVPIGHTHGYFWHCAHRYPYPSGGYGYFIGTDMGTSIGTQGFTHADAYSWCNCLKCTSLKWTSPSFHNCPCPKLQQLGVVLSSITPLVWPTSWFESVWYNAWYSHQQSACPISSWPLSK